jgi:hypothetical protein
MVQVASTPLLHVSEDGCCVDSETLVNVQLTTLCRLELPHYILHDHVNVRWCLVGTSSFIIIIIIIIYCHMAVW